MFWYKRRMLKEANSEGLGAIEVYEKIGAAKDVERCRSLLRKIERASRKLDFNGELLEVGLLPTPVNFPFSAQVLVTIPQIHLDALYHESSAPHRNGTDTPFPAVGLPIVSATSFLPPSKKPSPSYQLISHRHALFCVLLLSACMMCYFDSPSFLCI